MCHFLRQMYPLHLFAAPFAAPLFCCRVLAPWLLCGLLASTVLADELRVQPVAESDFASARDALIEAIEAEGLVVGAVLPFADMLERTGGRAGRPYADAVIVQFCSGALARRLAQEAPEQIALCPLAISVYATTDAPGQVLYAWRTPGRGSPGRAAADNLLVRLVGRAAGLARLR